MFLVIILDKVNKIFWSVLKGKADFFNVTLSELFIIKIARYLIS